MAHERESEAREVVEKKRRLRVFVIRELVQTEIDYCRTLDLLDKEFLPRMREQVRHDPQRFTPEIVDTLFCNVDEIAAAHRALLADLRRSTRDGDPKWTDEVGQVFLDYKDRLKPLYSKYGRNNMEAQKLLYDLSRDQQCRAFFQACLLMGTDKDVVEELPGYFLHPVQRICKYPLLLKELVKNTSAAQPDFHPSRHAVDAMKDICSEVNETKRRLEKLEFIDEWQSSIEGWEGANVVYTSNEMLKSGMLTKISSGNTQERAFFLFDNLLVYCKKQYSSGMSTRKRNKRSVSSSESEAAAKYQFKGRLPLNEIEIENVEDGTSDYHSNGKAVTNGWKVLNNAKRKWFVCIAKSAEEKKEWMDVIKREIEKGKHLKLLDDPEANQKATWSLIHDRALKLHSRMSSGEKPLIKDRKHLLKTHPKAFVGSEFVKWAMEQQEASSAEEAVALGQALLDNGFIHHINDRHNFKNSSQWYRFRFDDGTFKTKHESQDLLAKGTRVYVRLHGQFPSPLKEHMHHLKSIPFSITGSKLVDWMVENGDACKKEEALSLGQYLIGKGFLHHVSDKHQFKDDQLLFRFFADEEKKEAGSTTPTSKAKISINVSVRPDFHVIDSYTSKTIVLPCTEEGNDFAVEETEPITVSAVVSSSPAQLAGLKVGDVIQAVNGDKVAYSTLDDVLTLLREAGQHKEPLQLVILAERSHTCDIVADSEGLGFEVRGHNPVFVSSVTSGGPAADVGLMPGYCIMQVNGKDVSKASHNTVVSLIRNENPRRSNSRPSSVNLDDDDVIVTSKGDIDAESPSSKNRRSGFTLDDDLYDDDDLVRATLRKSVGRKRAQSLGRKKTDSFTTTDFSDVTNLMRAASLSSAGEKLKPCLSLTVGIGALEENVQYEYVSTEESRIYVFESLMESRYCFKVPSELYKIYAAEAERSMIYYENELGGVAENAEEFGARRDDRVARLKEQRQSYEQLALKLSQHFWPTFKSSQDRKKQTVAPCPTNCHLQVMEVDIIGNVDEEIPRGSSCEKVVYCYTTCGAPAAHYYDFTDGGLKKLYGSGQQHLVSDLKQLLHEVDSRLKVLESDQDLIRLIGHVSDTTKSDVVDGEVLRASLEKADDEDLPEAFRRRTLSRVKSMKRKGTTTSVAVASFLTKAEKLAGMLRSEKVAKAFKGSAMILPLERSIEKVFDSLETDFNELRNKIQEARDASNSESIAANVTAMLDMFRKHLPETKVRLNLTVMMEEDVNLLERRDCVFAQSLTALVTGFVHQLALSLRGVFNPAVEYGAGAKASAEWLSQVESLGLAVIFESLLNPSKEDEMGALEDMAVGVEDLRRVSFQLTTLPPGQVAGDNFPVALKGNRQSLTVILSIDDNLFQALPHKLQTGATISVHPVLISHTFRDLSGEGGSSRIDQARSFQLAINVEAVSGLKQYYRKLRSHQLEKTKSTSSQAVKVAVLDKVLRPLNAMEELVRILERSNSLQQERKTDNAGFLSLCSELTSRMGAVKVTSCYKGLEETAMSVTLDQALLLTRCHGLPPKSFRTALNVLRSQGVRIANQKKNVDRNTYSLKTENCSRLYVPPSSTLN